MQIKHWYQPVFNLVTMKIVGHEALLKGPNNEGPVKVLDAAARCGRLRETDALSFSMAVAAAHPGIAFANILPEMLVWLVRQGVAIPAGRRAPGWVCIEDRRGIGAEQRVPAFSAGYRGRAGCCFQAGSGRHIQRE